MLELQGNMTQMEKNVNRVDLEGYKDQDARPAAMVPGLFNESPLRNVIIPAEIRQALVLKHQAGGSLEELKADFEKM